MAVATDSRELLAINTIRTLSMDAVQAADSGHPGTPMALAPVAYVLYNEFLRYDPSQPNWPGRDRFVLSCGHASMLLYSVLHLCGVKQLDEQGRPTGELAVRLDDIRNFRQLGSRCPGHPEYGHTSGIETTTGPLGQGLGNSVGMAIASRWLSANYDRPGFDLFRYNVYALCSDGDMMEGISGEAASLAAHLKLPNLCWIYDDNRITIEGKTSLAFSEDVGRRFEGYGWQVIHVEDVNDLDALRGALEQFRQTGGVAGQAGGGTSPTLIIVRSHIAYGAPNAHDTAKAHGAPLGAAEIRLTKQAYGWSEDATFLVPDEARQVFLAGIGARGKDLRGDWEAKFAEYKKQYPQQAAEIELMLRRELPEGWDSEIKSFPADAKGIASRNSSGKVLNQVAKRVPWLLGGSADLAPSTKTLIDQTESFAPGRYQGRNFHFGIREHAMAATTNGLTLSGLRAYGSTFFVFSDYLRPSLRLSALMGLPAVFIFTHDSIGVGEDGPTHQPVEHLAALRAIPGLVVMRPGDANEVAEAYRAVLPLKHNPTALVLTRQDLPTLDRTKYAPASGVARGGYVLADAVGGQPEAIVIGTGSELSLAVKAYETLTSEGIKVRLVSLPSWELFEAQPLSYRQSVLPEDVTVRVAVEAGVRFGWDRYVGRSGRFVGMTSFGASAPESLLYKHFGITAENVVAQTKELLGRYTGRG
jgi:transketolase